MSDSNIETEGTANYDSETPGQGQPAQSGVGQESITDLLTKPLTQAYIKAIAALYAVIGVGMGLMIIAYEIIGESILEGGFGGEVFELTIVSIPISGAPHIAAVLALFVGGYLSLRMAADDRETMVTAAAGTAAGTVVLWVLSAFLAASQVDDVSVAISGLLINAIVLGLLVGAVAAGAVYVMRNLVPDVQGPSA